MPNSIKYKTGNLSGSLQKGNVALGLEVTGPSSTTGWYNGITPNPNQYIIYKVDPLNLPIIYAPSNQDELVRVAIQEGATNINTGSSTASILNYFAGQSNLMAVNTGYPSIVTDGLILLNDSSFTPSYPTTASTWYDISGNNKNGSLINGPLFDSNRGAITFDGINEIVTYGTGNTFFPLPSFSIELTFQSKGTVPTTGTSPGLFGFTYGIRLQVGTTALTYQISSGSTASGYPLSTNDNVNYRDGGRWYTVVCQTDATSSRIYVNGQFKNSRSLIWNGSTVWPTNGWNLGRDNNNVNQFFTGSISNLKIYNKILSQAEINQNYYGGPIVTDGLVFAVDASNLVSYESGSTTTYSLTGSLSGSLINGTGYLPSNGGVWDLDGTDDYIEVLDNNILDFGTGSFTIECFFKPDPTQSGGNFPAVMNKSVGDFTSFSGGVTGWILYWRTSANQYQFQLGDSSAAVNSIIFPGTINNDNTWRHLVVTIPSGSNTIRGYYNGNLVSSTTRTLTGSTDTNVSLTLGTWRQFARELNTELSISRIYNRELSASEVAQNFNAQRSRFGI